MVCYIKHDNLYKENGKKFSAKLNYKNLPAPCRIYEKKWKKVQTNKTQTPVLTRVTTSQNSSSYHKSA